MDDPLTHIAKDFSNVVVTNLARIQKKGRYLLTFTKSGLTKKSNLARLWWRIWIQNFNSDNPWSVLLLKSFYSFFHRWAKRWKHTKGRRKPTAAPCSPSTTTTTTTSRPTTPTPAKWRMSESCQNYCQFFSRDLEFFVYHHHHLDLQGDPKANPTKPFFRNA